jgi:hypothetical protein
VFVETRNPRIGTRCFFAPNSFCVNVFIFPLFVLQFFSRTNTYSCSCASLFRDQHKSRSFNKEMSHSLYPCPWPYFLKLEIGVLNMSIFACKTFLLVLCCNQEPLMLEETCKKKVWSFGGGDGVE